MAENDGVKTSTTLWSDEVRLADPEIEAQPEIEYRFSNLREFVRPK